MITIHNHVIVRLQGRLNKMWKAFGKKESKIKNLEFFINKILADYIDRKNREDASKVNNGITWVRFKRLHFNEVYVRDHGKCKYCNNNLSKAEATLDHILAPIRGGQNSLKNVTLCCHWCNNDKGILDDEEYYYKQLVNTAKKIYPPNSERNYVKSLSKSSSSKS